MIATDRLHRARVRATRRPPRRWVLAGMAAGLVATLVVPGLAAAHPLGNFTINHYAGLRVEPERVLLDVVIDQAEIPAFQSRLEFDTDGDRELSDAEIDGGRVTFCESLGPSLDLRVDGQPLEVVLTEAGLTFPPGAGGLSTMRSVCGFVAVTAAPRDAGTAITFADDSFPERIGWREVVVAGSGVTIAAGTSAPLRTVSPSERLTTYPPGLVGQPLADTEIAFRATPGGASLPAFGLSDADPVPGIGPTTILGDGQQHVAGEAAGTVPTGNDSTPGGTAVVPGGVTAGDLPAIFRTADLTPIVVLVSILTAAALGAGHALTPGHGKTLMAAYLVGSRGTPVHAAGLGLSVALSHTLGILALAALVVGAQGVLPPDVVVRTAPIIAAISIVAIGGWMLFGEARRRLSMGAAPAPATSEPMHGHGHPHEPAHPHEHGHDHPHGDDHAQGHDEHSHGGRRHTHLPAPGSSISWRSLFVLGLAGGLIPSASALLILLGSVAAGRPAFGFILVVAFGLGMALVMGGIGLALVIARGRLDRVDAGTRLGRAAAYLPLVASFFVLGFGLYLTAQAVTGTTTL